MIDSFTSKGREYFEIATLIPVEPKASACFWWILGRIFLAGGIAFWVVVALVALITIYLIVSCQYYHYKHNDFRKTKPFDPVVWQAINPQKEKKGDPKRYIRCNMYKDLVKNHLYFGMSYKEVVKLLGENKSVSYYTNPESKGISYKIGECTIICFSAVTDVQGYSLHLDFDRDSKLVEFGHHDDMRKEKRWFFKNLFKKGKHIFMCHEGECTRFIDLLEIKKWKKWFVGDCGSVCKDEEDCKRHIKYSDGCSVSKREECHKSEVESKWGYKVW